MTSMLRDFHYTHDQPQWSQVLQKAQKNNVNHEANYYNNKNSNSSYRQRTITTTTTTSSSTTNNNNHYENENDPQNHHHHKREEHKVGVVRQHQLAPERMCVRCLFSKHSCVCKQCSVCNTKVRMGSRHHCRRCWRAVCGPCWSNYRYVHLLPERTMRVCDRCAVPWALANLSKREGKGIYWGLYLLRRAGEMPCQCVMPSCQTFTYSHVCYRCHMPTVMTQPHVERLVRVDTSSVEDVDATKLLDRKMMSERFLLVGNYTEVDVEETFRSCFAGYEECTTFRGLTQARPAQDVLLAMVAAAVAYEYNNGPNITLALSDVPYAKLLRVHTCAARYSILEAPGKVKFISFPGTHNWRTRWVDMQLSQTTISQWADLVTGIAIDEHGEPQRVLGGRHKVWEYKVHSGFSQEAYEVGLPVDALIADVRRGYRLVFSGHSLGGAVAQLIAIQMLSKYPELLRHDKDSLEPPPLLCVSLGTPLLGNYQLVDRVVRSGWNHLFHNFVYRSDIVPRLSCGDELVWDGAAAVMERMANVYRDVGNWFKWRSNTNSNNTNNDGGGGSNSNRSSSAPTPTPQPYHYPLSSAAAAVDGAELGKKALEKMGDVVASTGSKAAVAFDRILLEGKGLVTGDTHTLLHERSIAAAAHRRRGSEEGVGEYLEEADEASLGQYMDTAIRTGRDVLAKEEDHVPSAMQQQQRREELERELLLQRQHSSSTYTTPPTSPGVAAAATSSTANTSDHSWQQQQQMEEEEKEKHLQANAPSPQEELDAAEIKLAQAIAHTRRMHRRFAAFGRYHFLEFGAAGYVSTDDSETVFGILKKGCDAPTQLLDHSVSSYNRAIMIALYSKR